MNTKIKIIPYTVSHTKKIQLHYCYLTTRQMDKDDIMLILTTIINKPTIEKFGYNNILALESEYILKRKIDTKVEHTHKTYQDIKRLKIDLSILLAGI